MDLLAEAPLAPVFGALILGLWLAHGSPHWAFALAVMLLCLGFVALLCSRWDRRRGLCALLVVCLSGVAGWLCSRGLVVPSSPGAVDCPGTVLLERAWGGRRAIVIGTGMGRFLVEVPAFRSLPEGSLVRLVGPALPLRPSREGGFDQRLYWLARGVRAEVIPRSLTPVRSRWSLNVLRWELRRRILLHLPPRTRGYLLAVLLGVKDPDLIRDHSRWGTAHLLAVSGFHVGVVAVWAWFFFGRRRLGWGAVSLVVWGYVLLAGGAASSLRAAAMIQLVLLGLALGRPASGVNSVAAAGIAFLVWRPWWLWDLGWQLSMTCATAMTALAKVPGTSRRMRAVLVSPVLWAVTAPLLARAFGSVPLAGVFLNLIAVPVFGVLLPLAVVLSIPALLGMPGGWALAAVPEGGFALWDLGTWIVWRWPSLGWSPWLFVLSASLSAALLALRFRVSPLRASLTFGAVVVLVGTVVLF